MAKRGTPEMEATDILVGRRIRARRIILGLTQQHLADRIGVTYQQIHKIERGVNRVSAGRLYEIARTLTVPLGYFFEELAPLTGGDADHERAAMQMMRAFRLLPDDQRVAVSALIQSMAGPA